MLLLMLLLPQLLCVPAETERERERERELPGLVLLQMSACTGIRLPTT